MKMIILRRDLGEKSGLGAGLHSEFVFSTPINDFRG